MYKSIKTGLRSARVNRLGAKDFAPWTAAGTQMSGRQSSLVPPIFPSLDIKET